MPHPRRFVEAVLQVRAFSPLRYREYRLLWFGQAFGTMGTLMDEVTRGWLIYELTDSVVQLGLVRGVQLVPLVLFAPLAGSAADRYSRKVQVMAAQLANVTVYAATAALIFTGRIEPWHVYVTAFLVAIGQVFQQPARASMVSGSVPRDYLTNAIGFNSLMFNISRGVGPALAGALIVLAGTGGAFAAQAALLLAASLFTLPLRPAPLPARAEAARRESFFGSILEGWKFSWRNETVRAGLACIMLVSLFIMPFTTMLPVFARDLLEVGADGQGLLLTGMGIGAFFSAALVANAGHRMPRGLMMLVGGVCYGLSVVLFAGSFSYALSFAAMVAAGLSHVYCNVVVNTIVQTYSPAQFRGRTRAAFGMHQAVITVGAMLYGALSTLEGVRWSLAIMGATGMLSIAALHFAVPRARHIR
ncbi:MAG: MFS transporter [Burkholderiales bacterium]|nr:MFS transporter [Burkholderiales bacterium]